MDTLLPQYRVDEQVGTSDPNPHYYRLDPNYHAEDEIGITCQSCGDSFRFEGTGYARCPHCRAVNFVFNSDKGKCIMLY